LLKGGLLITAANLLTQWKPKSGPVIEFEQKEAKGAKE